MIFKELLNELNSGKKTGITSVCSANKFVIEAAMLHAKENNYNLLVESTSNQVDQFGGYTRMTPEDFRNYVFSIARKVDLSAENIILGGDHLGPNVWQNQNSEIAMNNAKDQIAAYVSAGYSKIHLDTSFALADDEIQNEILSPEIITERAAQLCEVAERIFDEKGFSSKPNYVIGTDVPIPGGAIDNDEEIKLTTAAELEETIELSKSAFYKRGLEDAWERVIAVVVQSGVEFSDSKVLPYYKEKNTELVRKIESYKNLYLEAHSTDYQSKEALRQMVQDNFAILKVGPWLTFALREALYSLAYIENKLFKFNANMYASDLVEKINAEMKANPKYWQKHYSGNENEIYLAINFSYSDRIRYYWNNKIIKKAVEQLLHNLNIVTIPESLLSQFLPNQYMELRDGKIENKPEEFIKSKIHEVLSVYYYAVGGNA